MLIVTGCVLTWCLCGFAVGEGAMKTAKTRCPNLDYWHIKLAIALLEEMSERQVVSVVQTLSRA